MERKEVTVRFIEDGFATLERLRCLSGESSYSETVRKAMTVYQWILVNGKDCDILLRRQDGSMDRLVR